MTTQPLVYLNGDFLPLSDAKISVMDRGFLFADGVYEVIPVYNGHLFRGPEHLARLERSLEHIRLPLTQPIPWDEIFRKLIPKNGGGHQTIYLQITRGAYPARQHTFPTEIQPTVFVRTTPYIPPTYEQLRQGYGAITHSDYRWKQCFIKSIALLANVLLYQEAIDAQCEETILYDDKQKITEGATSNVFIVQNQTVITPPKNHLILGGITREFILELASKQGVPFEERAITLEELRNAEEIWVTSSSKEIKPIISLDGARVGNGRPGPVWEQMIQHYKKAVEQFSG